MNLLVENLSSVRKRIKLRKTGLLLLIVVMSIMALLAGLQFRIGEGQMADTSQSETMARLVVSFVFGLIALVLIVALIIYSTMCSKLLEPKELNGVQILRNNDGQSISLERCRVLPLYKTSTMWPLNTVTVLVDGRVRAYISVDLLDDAAMHALLDRWSEVRGLIPLRAQEYQDKVIPR